MMSNPEQAVKGMMQNNPQMAEVMNYVQQNGGDPQKAFYALAKDKGIDPNEIINQAKRLMNGK